MLATERAAKTAAQIVLTLGAGNAFNLFTADWSSIIGLALGGAILSYATSIVSSEITKSDDPTLLPKTVRDEES
jgi:orotate phosphoribosyltransferase